MEIFRQEKYRIWVYLIIFTVTAVFLCQNIAWANGNTYLQPDSSKTFKDLTEYLKKQSPGSSPEILWQTFKKYTDIAGKTNGVFYKSGILLFAAMGLLCGPLWLKTTILAAAVMEIVILLIKRIYKYNEIYTKSGMPLSLLPALIFILGTYIGCASYHGEIRKGLGTQDKPVITTPAKTSTSAHVSLSRDSKERKIPLIDGVDLYKLLVERADLGDTKAVFEINDRLPGETDRKVEAMRSINPSNLGKKANNGDAESIDALAILNYYYNKTARLILAELDYPRLLEKAEKEGNPEIVVVLEKLLSIEEIRESIIGAMASFNPEKLKTKAEKGEYQAVLALEVLGRKGNPIAKNALATLNPAGLKDQVEQYGDYNGIYGLLKLKEGHNRLAAKILKTLKLDKLGHDHNSIIAICMLIPGNPHALSLLTQLANDGIADAAIELNNNSRTPKGTLERINPAAIEKKALNGDDESIIALARLADNDNEEALNSLIRVAHSQKLNEYVIKYLVEYAKKGKTEVLDSLSETLTTHGHRNYIYYQAVDGILEIAFNKNIPEAVRKKALESFKRDFRVALSVHMKFNSTESDVHAFAIVNRAIDLIGTSEVTKASREAEKRFNRPPQKILFYLCMPEIAGPLVEAYRRVHKLRPDLDLSFLIGAVFTEGLALHAQDIMGGVYKLETGTWKMATCRFGLELDTLKSTGLLREDFSGYEPMMEFDGKPSTHTHGDGRVMPNGTYKSLTENLEAFAALLVQDKERFLGEAGRLGYTPEELSPDVIRVGAYLFYCSQNPVKHIRRYGILGIVGRRGKENDGGGHDGKGKDTVFGAQWPASTAMQLEILFAGLIRISTNGVLGVSVTGNNQPLGESV